MKVGCLRDCLLCCLLFGRNFRRVKRVTRMMLMLVCGIFVIRRVRIIVVLCRRWILMLRRSSRVMSRIRRLLWRLNILLWNLLVIMMCCLLMRRLVIVLNILRLMNPRIFLLRSGRILRFRRKMLRCRVR